MSAYLENVLFAEKWLEQLYYYHNVITFKLYNHIVYDVTIVSARLSSPEMLISIIWIIMISNF